MNDDNETVDAEDESDDVDDNDHGMTMITTINVLFCFAIVFGFSFSIRSVLYSGCTTRMAASTDYLNCISFFIIIIIALPFHSWK